MCWWTVDTNRTHRQTEELVGFFVNTLVRSRLGASSRSWVLGALRETTLDAYAHAGLRSRRWLSWHGVLAGPLFQPCSDFVPPFETVELAVAWSSH